MEKISTRRVLRISFLTKLNDVKRNVYHEIMDYIYSHEKEIDHYEYGRIPNFRAYVIVLKNGETKVWYLSK